MMKRDTYDQPFFTLLEKYVNLFEKAEFEVICYLTVCRAVGGPLVHGDAPGPLLAEWGRILRPVNHLLRLCHPHCRHPAHHGGAVGLPARSASTLVRHTHTHTHFTHCSCHDTPSQLSLFTVLNQVCHGFTCPERMLVA